MNKVNLLVTFLPKENDDIKKIEEIYVIKNQIGKLMNKKGYKFIITGDDCLKVSDE